MTTSEERTTSRHVPNSIGGALCGDSGGLLALPGETTTCPKCHNVVAHVRANLNLDCSVKAEETRKASRAAVLAAADYIAAHPQEYHFSETEIPTCGTPGCALGWVHHFSGIEGDRTVDYHLIEAKNLFPFVADDNCFYDLMDDLAEGASKWRHDANGCATTLRAFAEKYLP